MMSAQAYHYTAQYALCCQYYSQPTAATTSSASTSQTHADHHPSAASTAIEEWKADDTASWKSPTTINDDDLMFDGKPLNLLHEEYQRRLGDDGEGKRRGRSRVKK